MKNKFAKLFEYPKLNMQIVLMVTQKSDDETYGISITTYHNKIGAEVILTLGGYKTRKKATKQLDELDSEKAIKLFKDLLSEFGIDIDEYIK